MAPCVLHCKQKLPQQQLTKDTLAEWLRRRPAKPMGSPRVVSNPTGVKFEQLCFSFTRPGYAGMARAKVTLKKNNGRFGKPKLHLSDERTMPREAKPLRLCKTHQIAKTQIRLSNERTMPIKAKHLRLRKTYKIAKTKTTSVGQTKNVLRSKTFKALRNAPNSKNQNYIFWQNKQCSPTTSRPRI